MIRSKAVALVAACAALACGRGDGPTDASAPAATASRPGASAPNVLVVLADDLRWDALGSAGNRVVRTPALDRLAREGVSLGNLQVATPVCSPSRANLLTGLYSHEPGISFFDRASRFARARIAEGTETLATHLERAGYVTGFVGKAHLGGDPRRWGFRETPVYMPGFAFGEAPEKHKVLYVDGRAEPLPRDTTPRFGDAAIAFVDAHRDERWLLWLAFAAPHSPYDHDAAFPYDAEDVATRPPGYPPDDPLVAPDVWRGYYSETSALDHQVGRLLDRLDALGLADDTLVVFTSDNGVLLGSHGIREKSIWYEESTRVPGIVRWPGHAAPGGSIDRPIGTVDLLPTLLEIVGAPVPPQLRGASFASALEGRDGAPARDVAFSEAYREKALGGGRWTMARDDRFKLVHILDTDERHFYDLRDDPHETRDRIDAPAYRAEIDRLAGRLATWERGAE